MRAYLEQLLIPDDEVFIIKRHRVSHFTTPRHYHRELEIKFMTEGNGKGYIGDTIYEYSKNDLVLLGPNIPHHWESSDHFAKSGIMAECVYIQFREECLGNEFLEKIDNGVVAKLFQNSRSGIHFSGEVTQKAAKIIEQLWLAKQFDRTLLFLQLLHLLGTSYEYSLFTNTGYTANPAESDRLNKVYNYIISNFKDQVSVEKAASLVHMSKSAFCQYFKKRTLKNFSDFVNEVRLGHALHLLIEKEIGIAEACYDSGFRNISYFNRKFLEVYKASPREYIKNYKNKGISEI